MSKHSPHSITSAIIIIIAIFVASLLIWRDCCLPEISFQLGAGMGRSRSLFTGPHKVFNKTSLLREKRGYVGRALRDI